MTSIAPTQARISIIGAGPGGLTCARILQHRGLTVTVYDHEAGPQVRNQGGSLDLHADNGQIALREAGLLEEFFKLSRPEGQEMKLLDPDGTVTAHEVPQADELFKPEIDRGVLRDLLLDSVQPGTIRWGQRLESVSGPDQGPRLLHFADGTTVETDLVIGADGASSRVRPAISPAVPQYTGISFLEAWFDDVDNSHPEIAALVGQGMAHAGDGKLAMVAQRNGGNHIRVYLIQQAPVDWISQAGLAADDTDTIRALLLQRYARWSPQMRRLVTDNDGPYVQRPIFALPVPHAWEPNPTVTLLGDAAHLMPPLGVGVNLAMLDASELAVALATEATVADAVRAYESTMLPRSTETAKLLDGAASDLLTAELPDFGDDENAAAAHS